MGDILSLIEKAEAEIDQEKAKELGQKLKKAEFDYNDFLEQIAPGQEDGRHEQHSGNDARHVSVKGRGHRREGHGPVEAIILSMTPKERSNPGILNLSRKQRIAKGAGVPISEVNRIVKQFDQMKKMMKQLPGLMGGGGRRKGFGGLGGLMGGKLKMPF